jgi:hypothetical protein
MLFHDPENLNTEGELDWNELVKATDKSTPSDDLTVLRRTGRRSVRNRIARKPGVVALAFVTSIRPRATGRRSVRNRIA